jgi:hypothetical protein
VSFLHLILLGISATVISVEIVLAIYYWPTVSEWLAHHLWVVLIPFTKVIFKRLLALKLVVFLKGLMILLWHLGKLLILKLMKTLGVRYGLFFSQNRWYWIRFSKVMFLRRGKQFFRSLARFWATYEPVHRGIILIAFFPVVLVLFFMGLSFNVTRKTMVQKAQESALFEAATSASKSNRGILARMRQLDEWALKRIQALTPRGRSANE